MTDSLVTLTKEDFNTCDWQTLIEQCEEKTCYSYSKCFYNKLDEAKEQNDDRKASLFALLGNITSPILDTQDPHDPFKPEVILQTSRSAVVDDVENEQLELLKEIIDEIEDPEMKARVGDILWIKTKDYKMARIAINAYEDSFEQLFDPENWYECEIRIERALQLSAILRQKDLFEKIIKTIEDKLAQLDGDDPLFLSLRLMELLLDHSRGDGDKYIRISQKLAEKAETEKEWHKAKLYWECKSRWHALNKEQAKRNESLIAAAETYEKKADEELKIENPRFMLVSESLRSAITALKKIKGTQDKVKELHQRLLYNQEKATDEMIEINAGEVDVTDSADLARNKMKGKNRYEAMLSFVKLVSSPNLDELKNAVNEETDEVSLQHLITSIAVDEKGRAIAKQPSMMSKDLDEVKDAEKVEMIQHAYYYRLINSQGVIDPARRQLLLEYDIKERDFLIFVADNIFVPQGREQIFLRGFYTGLKGDLLTSTHLLIPQLENSIRHILLQYGAIPTSIETQGMQEEQNLNKLLFKQELKDILGEDLVFDLQGLLVEKFGSNLRNKMAHGLASEDEFKSTEALYLWWLTLRICFLCPILGIENPKED